VAQRRKGGELEVIINIANTALPKTRYFYLAILSRLSFHSNANCNCNAQLNHSIVEASNEEQTNTSIITIDNLII
jgi:hypothetical protein